MTLRDDRVDGLVRLAMTGTAVVVLLFLLSRLIPDGSSLAELKRYLNMGREGNFPTWWSAGLLLGTALLAVLAARGEPRSVARSWTAVAVTAALLSLDEASQLHERLSRVTGALDITVATYAWVLPGVVVLVGAGAVMLVVARALPRPVAHGLVFAVAVFFLGALGMEALYGATARDAGPLVRVGLILVEETLEVVGATVAFCVVGRHVVRRLTTPAGVTEPRAPFSDPGEPAPSANRSPQSLAG